MTMQTLSERRALRPEIDRDFVRLAPSPSIAEIMREAEIEEQRSLGGLVCALAIAAASAAILVSLVLA